MWLEDKLAYDEVMNQVRPQAVLVSGSGSMTCRGLSFVQLRFAGEVPYFARASVGSSAWWEAQSLALCCASEFECRRETEDVELTLNARGIEARAPACHSGHGARPGPPVQVEQHIIAPSGITSRLLEHELQVHITWVKQQLEKLHEERLAMPAPNLAGTVKDAEIPSRRKAVLVNHAAKSIATLDSSTAPIGMSCTPRVRWRQS